MIHFTSIVFIVETFLLRIFDNLNAHVLIQSRAKGHVLIKVRETKRVLFERHVE